MRIISWVNKDSGPSYHRCIMPLLLMEGVDVYITNNLLKEDFDKGCDILMYNRILPDHSLEMISKLKEKHGFKTCVDVDDFWELDPHHILYESYSEINFAGLQVAQIKSADMVFTTHERLAEEILIYNKNVHVIPNAIPKTGQFDIERIASPFTRLFWQGSDTHKEDINILQRPIDIISDISGKIKMVMGGYAEENDSWYKMVMDYTAKLKHQYKLLPYTNISEYYNHYQHADVCLVPLVNSRFNRLKSNLKVLEAANLGLPVIASNVHPYKDMPLLYCEKASDWIKYIRDLVKSRKRQKECGAELKEFCDINFNFSKINRQRKQIFEYESSKQTIS